MIRLASLITRFEADLHARFGNRLNADQRRALHAMQRCRSAASPMMQLRCADCERNTLVPHSCGHRLCPHCQHHESQQWLQRQMQRLVPADHFLLAFTLPAELRALAKARADVVLDQIMRCAWATVNQFAHNDRQLQGTPGAIAVLHTHSRRLDYHPHVHLVVPAAALGADKKRWRRKRRGKRGTYLFRTNSCPRRSRSTSSAWLGIWTSSARCGKTCRRPKAREGRRLNLRDVVVRPVWVDEEARFQALMQAHHYLGALPKFGQTLWYVAVDGGEWLALLVFSAAALKVGARDAWIGWDFRCQYARLHLIANNSRFLILPGHRHPHLASRVLGLAARRVRRDWPLRFGHPLWLLETFVDPSRFAGTCYRAANWIAVGMSRGYRRTRNGFSATSTQPKRVFVLPLIAHAARRLSQAQLPLSLCPGGPKRMVSAHTMQSLPDFFADIQDPRRRQGRRHPLPAVLSIAAAATLCGARGYKAMAQWAHSLGQQALARFRCRYEQRRYHAPSESIIRNVLIRVDPAELDAALQRWNAQFARADTALAIDGKTLCNAIDADGRRTHVLSLVGHDSGVAVAQKKSAPCPSATMAP